MLWKIDVGGRAEILQVLFPIKGYRLDPEAIGRAVAEERESRA